MTENIVYNSAINLIEAAKELKNNYSQNLNYFDKIHYAKEFFTIKISGPRRIGHTTSIAKISQEFDNSLVVFPNHTMKNDFDKLFLSLENVETILIDNVSVASLSGTGNINNNKCQSVIVDCSSQLEDCQIENIYQCTISTMNYPIYLFLQ